LKLSVDLIYEELKGRFALQRFGAGSDALVLKPPRFYSSGDETDAARVYIVDGAAPPKAAKRGNCLFIGPEEGLSPEWRACGERLVSVSGGVGPALIFNAVLDIFERYSLWDERLKSVLTEGGGIPGLVLEGSAVFDNCVTVGDRRLRVLAATVPDGDGWKVGYEDYSLPIEMAAKIRAYFESDTSRTEPYLHNDGGGYGGHWVYTVNIFVSGEYKGCSSLVDSKKPLRPCDYSLFRHFTEYVDAAVKNSLNSRDRVADEMKQAVRDLLDGLPVSDSMLEAITEAYRAAEGSEWIAARIISGSGPDPLPVDYICRAMNDLLDGCGILPYRDGIVACILLTGRIDENELEGRVRPLLDELGFRIGVGFPFRDLRFLRTSYRQACDALELSPVPGRGGGFCRFSDCVPRYILRHSTGDYDTDELSTPGTKRLKKLSDGSAVDYLETLRVYLDCETNAVEAARRLSINRSSLLKRLARIRDALDGELDTPGGRLLLRWYLYYCEYAQKR